MVYIIIIIIIIIIINIVVFKVNCLKDFGSTLETVDNRRAPVQDCVPAVLRSFIYEIIRITVLFVERCSYKWRCWEFQREISSFFEIQFYRHRCPL